MLCFDDEKKLKPEKTRALLCCSSTRNGSAEALCKRITRDVQQVVITETPVFDLNWPKVYTNPLDTIKNAKKIDLRNTAATSTNKLWMCLTRNFLFNTRLNAKQKLFLFEGQHFIISRCFLLWIVLDETELNVLSFCYQCRLDRRFSIQSSSIARSGKSEWKSENDFVKDFQTRSLNKYFILWPIIFYNNSFLINVAPECFIANAKNTFECMSSLIRFKYWERRKKNTFLVV